jgi:trehalose utilization protein
MTRVLVWNEFRHEKDPTHSAGTIYPKGIHGAIADGLKASSSDFVVNTATLDDPEHGLTEAVLAETDVLVWWGHMAHDAVQDDIVVRVKKHVVERGMGLIVLHSGHFSKIFKSLMGTTCDLKWRESDDIERVWVIEPSHPIAAGVPQHFELPEEMYGERFDIPAPDNLVMVSWFTGGEVFRSGATWQRGNGRVFYFRPGHETYPTYHHAQVQRVISNAVHWAKPTVCIPDTCPNSAPLEPLPIDSEAAERPTEGHR